MSKNFGFVEPTIKEDNYVFGSFLSAPKVVLNPSANWYDYLPKYEPQAKNYETYGCTVWGTLNALEAMIKKITGVEPNYSDRFMYNVVGINPPGHDPHDVAEKIRKVGLVDQEVLPIPKTLEEFKTPRPMTKELIDQAHKWLEQYGLQHEWVFTDLKDKTKRLSLMRECLRYSPLGISVTAWERPINNEYPSNGKPNTHWCVAFRIDEMDRIWVFDSYDHSIKTLTADHDVRFAKRYHLDTVESLKEKLNWLQRILQAIASILPFIKVKDTVKDTPEPIKDNVKDTVSDRGNLLDKMCQAIKEMEGWYPGSRSWRNKNPGNIKRGQWQLAIGYDKDGFAIFRTEADGMKTLKVMITNAATGKSRVYNSSDSLVNFFKKYAPSSDNNKPVSYASFVAKKMGVNPYTFRLKDLV